MISVSDAALLLRGWKDSKSPLRVTFKSQSIVLSAHCWAWAATEEHAVFALDEDEESLVSFSIAGCICGFADVPAEEPALPVGKNEKIESGIVCNHLYIIGGATVAALQFPLINKTQLHCVLAF